MSTIKKLFRKSRKDEEDGISLPSYSIFSHIAPKSHEPHPNLTMLEDNGNKTNMATLKRCHADVHNVNWKKAEARASAEVDGAIAAQEYYADLHCIDRIKFSMKHSIPVFDCEIKLLEDRISEINEEMSNE